MRVLLWVASCKVAPRRLSVNFLCFNGTRKPLLIHGFSPVNARLLTLYGTAFYAITVFNIAANFVKFVNHIITYTTG